MLLCRETAFLSQCMLESLLAFQIMLYFGAGWWERKFISETLHRPISTVSGGGWSSWT